MDVELAPIIGTGTPSTNLRSTLTQPMRKSPDCTEREMNNNKHHQRTRNDVAEFGRGKKHGQITNSCRLNNNVIGVHNVHWPVALQINYSIGNF